MDFVALAQGMGLAARRIETVGEIAPALGWSLASPQPALVEIVID